MQNVKWRFSFDLVPYEIALKFMQQRIKQIYHNTAQETIWLLEHPHMYSAGVSAHSNDLIDSKFLPVYQTNRGGRYTYHGPGQRIIYIMLDLKKLYGLKPNLSDYIFIFLQWIINALKIFGLKAERRAGRVGIWIINASKEYKIAAIGVKIKKWITYHGVALNVKPELSYYRGIVPCGITEHGVTSLYKLGVDIEFSEIDAVLYEEFYKIF